MTAVPALHLAGTYRRRVNASLARIWENVFDWEHLAHLHSGSFAGCKLLDRGPWGWRVALTPLGCQAQELEMRADRARGRYTSTTIAGSGAGTEICVSLTPAATDQVDVMVEFHLPESHPDRLAALGKAYSTVYAQLWDEDEAMMQARERALARSRTTHAAAPPVDLGEERAVRAALPVGFELGGAPFRLIDLDGELVAHSTVCPHWLGPLDTAPVVDGEVRCPWHGYRFSVATGRCRTHPELRIAPAPVVRIEAGRVVVGPAGLVQSC